ncbi:hypothetical protein AB0F13_22460 [Streptomyces sp. NPDC026206]|uniref:hypothetical protein n=1 Tax=Streptomyces sp. NPDC026206 TaxID=3157089 RepID=UPI0033BFCE3B
MTTHSARALTVPQPWASCIAHGTKRVLNRPQPTDYRGPILIHAGHTTDHRAWNAPLARPFVRRPQPAAAIVSVAWLNDCHAYDGYCTLWSGRGLWHWRLTNVTPLPKPVPWSGTSDHLWLPPAPLLTNPRIVDALETTARA